MYRLGSLELVARELDRKDLAPRAKSARLAWARRRVQGQEPLDCGQEVRKKLDHYKPTLDQFNTARDALVCCPVGENDHFLNIFCAEFEGESEKKILDAGSQLLRRQLDDTCNPVVATGCAMQQSERWFHRGTMQAYCIDFCSINGDMSIYGAPGWTYRFQKSWGPTTARLGTPDPVVHLYDLDSSRVNPSKQRIGHLHPPMVSQRPVPLASDTTLHRQPEIQPKGELTEVTQVLRVACSCDVCGLQFASFHALRTHIGKSHPEFRVALTKEGYATRSERKDDHMRYAKDGSPQCNQCFKKFSGWPGFMAHFNQKSCPTLHTQGQEAEGPSSIGDSSA